MKEGGGNFRLSPFGLSRATNDLSKIDSMSLLNFARSFCLGIEDQVRTHQA